MVNKIAIRDDDISIHKEISMTCRRCKKGHHMLYDICIFCKKGIMVSTSFLKK